MRKFVSLRSKNLEQFKTNVLAVCNNYETAIVLNSQGYSEYNQWFAEDSNYDLLAALDNIDVTCNEINLLKPFANNINDWLFGYITYDAKNSLENSLSSTNIDRIGFDEVYFFVPRYVITIESDTIKIGFHPKHNTQEDTLELFHQLESKKETLDLNIPQITINQTVSRDTYKKK